MKPVVDVGLIPNTGVVPVPVPVPEPGVVPVDGVMPGAPVDGVVPALLQENQNKKRSAYVIDLKL